MAAAFAPPSSISIAPQQSLRLPTMRHRTWARPRSQRAHASAASPSGNATTTSAGYKFEGVSWSQVEEYCTDLSSQAKPEGFDVVLAVTRGGLIPAALLCEAFELRNVLSTTVIFYTDDGEQFFGMTEPRFLSFPSPDALEGRRVLIVDDVWDTGRTAHAVKLRVMRANPKLVKVAVLHYKPEMNEFPDETPDFYATTTANWVVYPWERASPSAPVIAIEGAEVSGVVEQGGAPSDNIG